MTEYASFLADYGHFEAAMQRRDGYDYLVARFLVVAHPSNRELLTWMRRQVRPGGATVGGVFGSDAIGVVTWVVNSQDACQRLSRVWYAAGRSRGPVIQAWTHCLALTPQAVKARAAREGVPYRYRTPQAVANRAVALARLDEATAKFPPVAAILPAHYRLDKHGAAL